MREGMISIGLDGPEQPSDGFLVAAEKELCEAGEERPMSGIRIARAKAQRFKDGADQRLNIAGIERERLFIKAARLRHIFGSQSLIRASHALEIEVHRVGKRCPLRAPCFGLDQLCAQLTGEARDNLVLHVEEIGHGLVERSAHK